MKIPNDDGGSAFPSHGTMGEIAQQGMSLRDYFSASALTNLRINEPAYDWKIITEAAYKYADVMIEARNK